MKRRILVAFMFGLLLVATAGCAQGDSMINLRETTITQVGNAWKIEVKSYDKQLDSSTSAELALFVNGQLSVQGTGTIELYEASSYKVKIGDLSTSIPIYGNMVVMTVTDLPFDPRNPPKGTYRLRICEPTTGGEALCSYRETTHE